LNNNLNFSTKISAITKQANLSYSNNIYEARIKEHKDSTNMLLPMHTQISYEDFVYEK
jgi:hypothetical protein